MGTSRWAMAVAGLVFVAAPSSAQRLLKPDRGGVPENNLYDYGVMGPPASATIVAHALRLTKATTIAGPFRADWASIETNYRTPSWLADAKFGIFIHWGVYSAAAYHNEWYEKHMYDAHRAWHASNFGPQERVGYKDLIPLFTASRWDPDEWAALFKAAGATFVIPTAQHHDNFALWDSEITPFNARKMGPKRDLIGQLSVAVRKQGMRFGLSNHGIENFTFINPAPALDARLKALGADLYDPRWRGFYNVADRSPPAMSQFLADWVDRNVELIDKYRPDILWFDNGANLRVLDPLKLAVAAHYYNRARQWGKQVSISTKFVAYAPSNDDRRQIGSIIDFEQVGKRSPADIRPGPWIVDDSIGSSWGYTRGMRITPAPEIIARLADTASKGGTYLLNISPMADGTIPDDQRATLIGVGQWLAANGEAIYGTKPWRRFGEGGPRGVRFTARPGSLYVITLSDPGETLRLASLGRNVRQVRNITVLGKGAPLRFRQDNGSLTITMPTGRTGPDESLVLRLDGDL